MPRFLPVAMTALTVLASQAPGSLGSSVESSFGSEMSRVLFTSPSIYDQVDLPLGASNAVEFGNVVAMSDDGLRLAVGVPEYNWTTVDDSLPVDNLDGGAVYVFDYVGGSWVYKTGIFGTAGENLGSYPMSLSPDGDILAIRHGGAQPRPAKVYQIPVTGAPTLLGGDVTCAAGGNMLALTETATATPRLALGCQSDGTGGETRVLDWDGTAWVEVAGSPLALGAAGLFGFDVAWANDGTRLAVSAPNFQDTLSQQGLVRVYNYDGTTFNQLGADLKGTEASEKLGFTMDISSDGDTLVIGSPNKDNGGDVDIGAVQVYTLSGGTTWQFRDEEFGSDAGDQYGFGVEVSSDGSKFMATSPSHNVGRGQLRVFEFDSLSGAATELAEIEGSNDNDGIAGVAMSSNGETLAAGSINAQTTGIVQIFTPAAPSSAPSLAPSASPAPTTSPAPTADVPIDPLVETFDWDLFRVGDAEIVFSEDADSSEIKLNYNISRRGTRIEALESDCSTPIPSNVTTLTSTLVPTSASHANFTVDVNIAQDNITDYPGVWTDVATGEGLISLCVRVDLVLDDAANTSVTFHEQKIYVDINLVQGFEVTGIDLTRLNATEETGSADFDYNVTACHCNTAGTCINTVLTQGSDVLLCVETTAPNVEISDIRELTMTQGAFNTTPIVAGEEDALTVTTIAGKEATIQYQIISAFFSDPDPLDIVASGSVLLSFTDDDGRRLLRSAKVEYRELKDEQLQEGFNVKMEVESADSSGACGVGVAAGGMLSVMVIVIGGVGGAVW